MVAHGTWSMKMTQIHSLRSKPQLKKTCCLWQIESKLGRYATACYHATTSVYPLLSYVLVIESLVTIVTTPALIKSYLPGLKPGRVTSD